LYEKYTRKMLMKLTCLTLAFLTFVIFNLFFKRL